MHSPVNDPAWVRYTHPEGLPYYHNTSRRYAYLTENNLRDPVELASANRFATELEKRIDAKGYNMPECTEIVLQLEEEQTTLHRCGCLQARACGE